jgi:YD repeat-containing protein
MGKAASKHTGEGCEQELDFRWEDRVGWIVERRHPDGLNDALEYDAAGRLTLARAVRYDSRVEREGGRVGKPCRGGRCYARAGFLLCLARVPRPARVLQRASQYSTYMLAAVARKMSRILPLFGL